MQNGPACLFQDSSGRWVVYICIHRSAQFFHYERDPAHGEYNLYLSPELGAFLREHAPNFELKWKINSAYLTLNDPHAEVAFRMQFETTIIAAPTHHW